MPETISIACDGKSKWMWYDAMSDLQGQGRLGKNVYIDPTTVQPHFMGGCHNNNHFSVTWAKDRFLIVTCCNTDDPKLISAFSHVVGYRPFAKYNTENGTTYEWDKIDTEGRWHTLQTRELDDLVRIENTESV